MGGEQSASLLTDAARRERAKQAVRSLRGDMPSMPVHDWALVHLQDLRVVVAIVESLLEGE